MLSEQSRREKAANIRPDPDIDVFMKAALISLRNSLNDPLGVLNNWNEASVDPCSWAMISCSPENLVTTLGAPSQILSGTLSGRIGNLTNLKQVLLQNNNISREIPAELGQLSRLQNLDLSSNGFYGIVPDSLGG